MEKKKTIYLALAVLLTLTSCVQDDPGDGGLTGEDNRIYFRSYLPEVTQTRAGVVSKENLTECQVTCINPDDNTLIDPATGEMIPYFSDICFEKEADGRFMSQGTATCDWPSTRNKLHFFAYYPSVASMRKDIDEKKFNLVNKSRIQDGTSVIDYRLESFRVAPNIADQVDFITAYSNGTQQENGKSGILLNFSHQLARIELSAWSASDKYDFEIAGLRVGNPLTQGDFSFYSLSFGNLGVWTNTAGHQTPVEHIFAEGESIVRLSKSAGTHASEDAAASIMGNAGPAMVIPMAEKIEPWEGKGDPQIGTSPYSTNKLYFSVLLRVSNRSDNKIVYPYPNDRDNIPVVYLAIGNDGTVTRRLYKIDGEYYTVFEKNDEYKYTENEMEKICGFCWAALPVGAKWEAGKIYTYKLNYSNGIGWHDPSDPNPGEPIIERGAIPVNVSVVDWAPAENYNPNLDVPKR